MQTLVIQAGARHGKPWAGKVVEYEAGKPPVVEFGKAGPVCGSHKDPMAEVQVPGLEAGDLVYRTSNDSFKKEFCQVRRGPEGLSVRLVGTGLKVREIKNQAVVLRQELEQNKTEWFGEIDGAKVEKFSDLVRVTEIIARFLRAGFYLPIPAPRLDKPGEFSQDLLVMATERLMEYLHTYPEHADLLRAAVLKLGEYKSVRARLVQNKIERANAELSCK